MKYRASYYTLSDCHEEKELEASDRAAFDRLQFQINDIHNQAEDIRADLAQMREGLTHAAQPAPVSSGQTETMQAIKMTRTRTSGKWYYKMLGGRYIKRGVTVWDEVLKALQLDPATLQWNDDDSFLFDEPLNVTILLKEYKDEESGEMKITPQKVTGKA